MRIKPTAPSTLHIIVLFYFTNYLQDLSYDAKIVGLLP